LIGAALRDRGMPFLVVEESRELIESLRKENIEVIAGTAGQPGLLDAANLAGARWLIIAIPSPFETGDLVERARKANPAIRIIARAHSDAEVEYLSKLGADQIVLGEREIANEMTSRIVRMEAAGSAAGA
jgi:CPA2 family monovalent cation:H+ antiporter-2